MKKLTLLWSLIVVGLMWYPFESGGTSPLAGSDAAIHFGLFLIAGVLWYLWPTENRIYPVLAVIGLAVVAECGQFLVPTRSVTASDLAFNFLGLAAGVVIAKIESNTRDALFAGGLAGGFSFAWGAAGSLWGELLIKNFSLRLPVAPGLAAIMLSLLALAWLIYQTQNLTVALPVLIQIYYLVTYLPRLSNLAVTIAGLLLTSLWLAYACSNKIDTLARRYLIAPAVGTWILASGFGGDLFSSLYGETVVSVSLLLAGVYYFERVKAGTAENI